MQIDNCIKNMKYLLIEKPEMHARKDCDGMDRRKRVSIATHLIGKRNMTTWPMNSIAHRSEDEEEGSSKETEELLL